MASIAILATLLFIPNIISAQHVVKTTDELIALLAEEKDQGTILLDGDLFHIAGVDVKAGGIIKPYPGRKPVLIGFHQKVERGSRIINNNGNWTVPIESYGYSQIYFLDENLEPIPYSCHIDGKKGFEIVEEQIQLINKEDRIVSIPIPQGFEYLKNRDKSFFKNFSIKLSYWFLGMTFYQIYSDSSFLYGTIDNKYNLDLLLIRPWAKVRIEFFNLPRTGDGIFLDGDDVLNVPSKYSLVRVCTTPPILNLVGNMDLSFVGISFTGANGNSISLQGSNKHFKDCVIRNCGSGIVASKGSLSNCSVERCLIENLYNNVAINLENVDKAVVNNNVIRHTGTLMKGGPVITVGGLNFLVNNNSVTDFSYIGICASKSKEFLPGTMTGVIRDNIVDNIANYGNRESQLTDGGGIYVITHTDGVVIENNIIRNIGYDGGELWGIYLDDGAYNCTVRHNLVYNLWPGQYVITARYVDECDRSCMNNVIENNIFLGPCKIAGNRKGFGNKTIIRNNYIDGNLNTQGDEYVSLEGNKHVSTAVRKDGKVVFCRGDRFKKRGFTRSIRRLIKR